MSLSASATTPVTARRRPQLTGLGDQIILGSFTLAAWLVLLLVAALFITLVIAAWPAIKTVGLTSLQSATWDPNSNKFGVLSFIYGTIVTSAIALLLAGPIGIGAALLLAEVAPKRLATPVALLIELLAAVPSVVFGIWGLYVLAPVMRTVVEPALQRWLGFLPLFQGMYYGIGMLTAGVLLAIMVLPTVTAISRDIFEAVPRDQREAMLALGSTKWEMLTRAVIPYARSGIIGALVLALGRALGEAMAVTMVIGNKPAIALSLFAPGYTMASVLANEFTEATGQQYVAMLIGIGSMLFILSMILNVFARLLVLSVAGARGARR
ncbi:MAG: phosphate ABC transporter permease subunit PstC [Candidatus Eremiobacteraeota bacterium]|nr:phosphate ABC transporter permease subunit PstC [Candidatus Eremiobacteraeota bacterium]MBV8339483.1 phosphate ABC transporter permease subunit PstC [Candidatus Eremiobacteraeota bacterium]MBV8460392.1 phosphate ABC transporter permease subunit PstC [Candidatus Eremiobacteraeota bacterium]MBV8595237.1 phosphate ABC transporter permease subunit PstC [Candidatus Eremiobacteraeota bacterium]